MKLPRMMLAVLASLAISAVSVQAIPYLDLDLIGVKLDSSTTSYSGEFNIPAGYDVTSASVWFVFSDDELPNDIGETVKVDLGLVGNYFGEQEVNVPTVLDGTLSTSLLWDLSEDGVLKYKINRTGGDFYVGFAKLLGELTPKTGNAVPDGGATVALLGLGLLGLSAVGRKMRS